VGKIVHLLVEDRFGYISERVPRFFRPKTIVQNFAKPYEVLLKRCENPEGFPLPPSEPEVPDLEGYTLNVFLRLAYPLGVKVNGKYRIRKFKEGKTEPVFFEMKFPAGSVPFADISVIRLYVLEEISD
jgi:hypothetical protein